MVRDRVVIGCYSEKVREKLIQEGSKLTLEKAGDIARTQEMSTTQLQTMAPEQSDEKYVNSLKVGKERKFKSKEDRQRNKHQNAGDSYRRPCGKFGITHEQNKCPAKCKRLNYFARVCKSKHKEKNRQVQFILALLELQML
jgi:hypothetical protein